MVKHALVSKTRTRNRLFIRTILGCCFFIHCLNPQELAAEPPTVLALPASEEGLARYQVNDLPPNRRDTSMVFQSYAIFPPLSVAQNIGFGLELKGWKAARIREEVERIMEVMNLRDMYHLRPDQLSGGQQQRVALARAIINKPSVLLFDEPLSNLDAKLREQMRVEIRRIQQTFEITSVYVTHDQAEAMTVSDRIVVMNDGEVMQIGTPFEIYSRPANLFVADFIGKVNLIEGRVTDIKGKAFGVAAACPALPYPFIAPRVRPSTRKR